jgi:hypothetical protein
VDGGSYLNGPLVRRDIDAARALVETAPSRGTAPSPPVISTNFFDSSLPSYEPNAAALLTRRGARLPGDSLRGSAEDARGSASARS